MRPRYLEIEGLQSFKELQEVNFDELGEIGLFGIFGPTGSGKSSILDAITLALYGNVQRASRGTQGIINTDCESLRVAFTFDLLKDGERKTFRVERTYRRKKESANSAEARVARLFQIVDEERLPIADKAGEVTGKVEELLGLKLDDFTRSVVLPQNKFQEFLFLEKAKKREMLERIFYLEEYGRQLSDKVSKKISWIKNELSRIGGGMAALGDISEKSLLESESRLKEAHANKDNLDKELKVLEAQYIDSKEVWELTCELEFVREKEDKHLAIEDEVNAAKNLYESSVKAEGLIDVISKYKEIKSGLFDTEKQFEAVCLELKVINKNLEDAKIEYENTAIEVETEKPRLIELKAKLLQALEIKRELDIIDEKLKILRTEYTQLREKLTVKENEIKDKRAAIDIADKKEQEYKEQIDTLKVDMDYRNEVMRAIRFSDDLKGAQAEREKLKVKHNEALRKVNEVINAIGNMEAIRKNTEGEIERLNIIKETHEKSKPGERNEIIKEIGDCHQLRGVLETIKTGKHEMEGVLHKLNTLASEAGKLKEEYKIALIRKDESQQKLEESKNIVEELVKLYEKNTAYIISRSLKHGESCPVCGSKDHPEPAASIDSQYAEEIEKKLKISREALIKREQGVRNAENECIKLEEKVKSIENVILEVKNEATQRGILYKDKYTELPDKFRSMEPEDIEFELKNKQTQNELRLKQVEVWELELDKIKVNMTSLGETLSSQLLEEGRKKAELEVLKDNLLHDETALKEAGNTYLKAEDTYRTIIKRLNINDAGDENLRILEKDKSQREFEKKLEMLQLERKKLQKELEALVDEKQKLSEILVQVENDGKNFREQKLKEEQRIRAIAGEKDVIKEIEEADNSISNLVLREKKTAERVKELEQQFNTLNTNKITIKNQKDFFSRSADIEGKRLKSLLAEKGFSSIEEVEKALLDKETQEGISKRIKNFETEGRNLEAQKNILLKKLNNRSITEEQWHYISKLYIEKKALKEESISSYEEAKNHYNMIKCNFAKWLDLNREYKEYNNKNEMMEHIQKLLKGNSFIEFISEERLRYVAKEASETLGTLTKYKYALELDTENGFVIRDNANGGVHRLVTSLSGGETFLTSLSLALALSKQIQLKGQSPLEFFFLDEGFGTLDANLLDAVVDSLERISTSERVIGLISHVPELRNRMARRLVVEPPAPGVCGSRVKIEKA